MDLHLFPVYMFNVLYHALVLTLWNCFWSHQGFKIVYFKILYYYLKRVCESHSVVLDSLWPHGLYSPWHSPDRNTGVGSLSLLQGIFPTQVSHITGGFFINWAIRELQPDTNFQIAYSFDGFLNRSSFSIFILIWEKYSFLNIVYGYF